MNNGLKLQSFEDVEVKEIEWLWKPYLPKGKLCIIEGEPGSGKTTMVLQLAALLTKGLPLPFDEENERKEPMNVIYQTAEDGYDDTIVPRFIDANGDLSRMYFINDDEIPLSMLDQRIEEAIIKTNACLFILDPIQAFLGSKVNMNMANEVRPLLRNLSDIAARTNCCITLIGHFNKNSKDKAINRLSGSIDFMAACRSALIVTQYNKDKDQRNVMHLKSSLSHPGNNFCFYLRKDEGFSWGEIITLSDDEIIGNSFTRNKKEIAVEKLIELTEDGPISSTQAIHICNNLGISKRTIDEAKKLANIESVKIKDEWYYQQKD